MKSPLKIGAVRVPKNRLLFNVGRIESGKARRIASLSAAGAIVVGVAAGSALFVDYLADRALARTADAPAATVKQIITGSVDASAPATMTAASSAPAAVAPAQPSGAVIQPQPEPIEATLPDAEAIAKVAAVGPEHAIEVPTDDPTGDPVLAYADEGSGDEAFAEDETMTSAIPPEEAVPTAAPKPKKKVAKAKPAAVEKETEVASLPGVNVGGLAGHPSDDGDTSGSTVRTVVKSASGGAVSGTAKIRSAVNMRSSPKKGSSVLGVVPAGTTVTVQSCDQWCSISWNGKSGWVYKSFLSAAKG